MKISNIKNVLLSVGVMLAGCTPSWNDGPYEVYWINGKKSLGYNVGNGSYIKRIDEPRIMAANEKFLSVYACPQDVCAYYYIDLVNDHKYAESEEFVYGPHSQQIFTELQQKLGLPALSMERFMLESSDTLVFN